MENQKLENQRSGKQNRSMHKLFRDLAIQLNTLGLDAKLILKPTYKIWWTEEMIKRDLWKPLQEAMYSKKSTTLLTRTEVSEVFRQLAQIIGEKHGVEIDFPSEEEMQKMGFYEKQGL